MHEIFDDIKDALFGNERQADFSQFAKRYNLTYQKKFPFKDFDFELRDTFLFTGKKRKVVRNFSNQALSTLPGSLQLFDYFYYPDSGKKSTTVALLESATFNFPSFLIRPKRTIEKLGSLFVKNKVEFKENPVFNQAYVFTSASKNTVKPLIRKELLDLLLTENHLWVEGKGPFLLVYEKNKLQPMDKLLSFYEDVLELAELINRDPPGDFV